MEGNKQTTRCTNAKNCREEMDGHLELALLEVASSSPQLELPMSLSHFNEHLILSKNLNCKQSSYGSTLKWARAMNKKGLLVLKERKRRDALVTSVSGHSVRPSTGHATRAGLTASALSLLDPNESEILDDNIDDNRSEFSSAMSLATTTNSVATSAYTYQPKIGTKKKQKQYGIDIKEIQQVLKHGVKVHRQSDGRKVLAHESISIVTRGRGNDKVLSARRHNIVSDQEIADVWVAAQELAKEADGGGPNAGGSNIRLVRGISQNIAKALDFIFQDGGSNVYGKGHSILEMDIMKYCDQFLCTAKKQVNTGRLRELTFLVSLQDEMNENQRIFHAKHTKLYCKIVDALAEAIRKSGSHETVMEHFQNLGSPRFWNAIQSTHNKKEIGQLRGKIKTFLAERAAQERQLLPRSCVLALQKTDRQVATTGDELAALVLELTTTTGHIVEGDPAQREGLPPYVTVAVTNWNSDKRKSTSSKKCRRKCIIAGFSDRDVENVASEIRKGLGCNCQTKDLDPQEWNRLTNNAPHPPSKRIIFLNITQAVFINLLKILSAKVPLEYRRFVQPRGSQDQQLQVPDELDPYMQATIESARLQLEELYREYNPEKLSNIPRLLEKYAGKEAKLVKTVREKYSSGSNRQVAKPELPSLHRRIWRGNLVVRSRQT